MKEAKLGILFASTIAGIIGATLLKFSKSNNQAVIN
jgi:Na+/H+ antiporter NhaA